jgi:endo-1,4-beta-mannosidase
MLTLAFEKLHREFIRVSDDGRHFIGARSGRRFTPLGFNYDHDEHFRLLEDYWHDEWEKVVADMTTMRDLGANVIRIHLQLAKFLRSPTESNERELEQLDRLIRLARSLGLYLDLVGLCCYHSWEVPEWYDNLDSAERWQVQAFFWEMIASRYAHETAIFCFDLMNEPVVPGRKRPEGGWLGKEFAGKNYIQFITLDGTAVSRIEVAREWLTVLKAAIRRHDSQHLVTVGLVDWSLPSSPMKSGFFPRKIIDQVDFISAHLYPESGKPEEMLNILKEFCVGKPVVIDETFHLKCSVPEQEWFLSEAVKYASGFMSFYTDFLSERIDNGRNERLRDSIEIFKRIKPLFVRRV